MGNILPVDSSKKEQCEGILNYVIVKNFLYFHVNKNINCS